MVYRLYLSVTKNKKYLKAQKCTSEGLLIVFINFN